MNLLRFKQTAEFREWRGGLAIELQARIDARFDAMRLGIFGDSRSLGGGLFEFRWKNGMRVYFSRRAV